MAGSPVAARGSATPLRAVLGVVGAEVADAPLLFGAEVGCPLGGRVAGPAYAQVAGAELDDYDILVGAEARGRAESRRGRRTGGCEGCADSRGDGAASDGGEGAMWQRRASARGHGGVGEQCCETRPGVGCPVHILRVSRCEQS
ncbi:hypothetical protein Micbo1qcDRAFT_155535, partial [Microdochium bolleyi]